jgi:enoyl-CoA hydratase/carnithine racemase
MAQKRIEIDVKAGIACLTLQRPERLNAFDAAMFAALEQALDRLAGERVRAVVITGAGDRAFCAGFDVDPDNPMVTEFGQAIEASDREAIAGVLGRMRRAVDRLVDLPVPVIAAINGRAYGGGAELAVRCDLRVMAPEAEICFAEVRLGLMPDWGGGAALAQLAGPSVAADLILTARPVPAAEALRLGLINRISASGEAFASAKAVAAQIAANGPQAVRGALSVIRASRNRPLSETLAFELQQAAALIAGGECLHGITAFLAGEPPAFPD